LTTTPEIAPPFFDMMSRIKLRHCASVGAGPRVLGRVWVHGEGKVHVGDGVVFDARNAPIELMAHRGGELHIGSGVCIESGASVEAAGRLVIGSAARLGSFCKILDNPLHPLRGDRHQRPESRRVTVEDGAEIGAHAILLPGARVRAGAVVPDGAVVSRPFGKASTVAGTSTREPDDGIASDPPAAEIPNGTWTVAQRKLRGAVEILLGTWYLHGCERGRHVRASGRVRVANQGRIRLGDRCTFIGGMIPTELTCGPTASIEIGAECVFNYYVTIDARESVRIGSRAIFGSGVRILDHGRGGVAPVRIEDDVWVAHGAVIEPGVTIGRGSVVSAGTVVSSDVPPDSLAIGNPVRCMSLELRSSEPAAGTRRPRGAAVSA